MFYKKTVLESINEDLKAYGQMLEYSLHLEKQILGLETDIKSENWEQLRRTLAVLLEAAKAMYFLRLSSCLEKLTIFHFTSLEVLLLFYRQVLLEWQDIKTTIQNELNDLKPS